MVTLQNSRWHPIGIVNEIAGTTFPIRRSRLYPLKTNLATTRILAIPAVTLILAWLGLYKVPALDPSWAQMFVISPYLVIMAGMLLGLRWCLLVLMLRVARRGERKSQDRVEQDSFHVPKDDDGPDSLHRPSWDSMPNDRFGYD